MRASAPAPTQVRPPYWPWPPGQLLGVTDRHCLLSDTLLYLHGLLAPSSPSTGWDAGPFLEDIGLQMDDDLTQGVLKTLERYRLARFEPEFTAWCKNHPQMGQKPRKPPLLGWRMTPEHLDVWWHLAHPESNRAWDLSQAQERCPSWTTERVYDLRQAALAEGFTRVAPRGQSPIRQ